ncbi:DAN domain family member 5 [Tamandua tetradactyla]|uniref:DAN domain family member 5 n=1 Tax=Tamandua tetradactyla TaxID=48850 RepID=UPI0040549A1E
MLFGQLAALLSLLSGAQLLAGRGRPRGPPPQPWATANQTKAVGPGTPMPLVPASALSSWKAFLGRQRTRRLGTGRLLGGQEVAATTMSLPLDPQEVARETCKAVPFTHVISRPGCTAARLRNHLCFGRCSSLYVPSSEPTPLALCNSCVPTRQRRAPVALWCWARSPPARWQRVKMSAVLVEGCQCSPKPLLCQTPGSIRVGSSALAWWAPLSGRQEVQLPPFPTPQLPTSAVPTSCQPGESAGNFGARGAPGVLLAPSRAVPAWAPAPALPQAE